MSKIDMVFNGDIFPSESFKFSDVYISLITQHMRGIATSKGLEELDKLNITKL
jgi:histone acetyltransferase (RNA polymerase elongator complex component)